MSRMSTLATYVFVAMQAWFMSWPAVSPHRKAEIQEVAVATASAAETIQLKDWSTKKTLTIVDTAMWLTGVGMYESGWREDAKGRAGEVGVWQLLGGAPKDLTAQAREAIRRWNEQGPNGYTGEGYVRRWEFGIAPLAMHREMWGALYVASHPYDFGDSQMIAREP